MIGDTGLLWNERIPMCWDRVDGFGGDAAAIAEAKDFVYRTIMDNWVDPTRLEVSFEDCPTGSLHFPFNVRIYMRIGDPSYNGTTVELGTNTITSPADRINDVGNVKPGLLIGFPSWWNADDIQRSQMRALVLHEFGHILGFRHEQAHPDGDPGVDPCYGTETLGEDGVALGPPDPASIMGWSYCYSQNNTTLSPQDIINVREVYGASRTHFGAPKLASSFFCLDGEECRLGDIDGDGSKDLVAFSHGVTGNGVWAGITSNAPDWHFGTPQPISSYFCVAGESCEVADVNGDGRDDLVAFTRGGAHSAWVALNTPNGFTDPQLWSSYVCLDDEVCKLADVDGDGRADVVVFSHGPTPQAWVLRSQSIDLGFGIVWNQFGSGELWSDGFCQSTDTCDVGDLTGDGLADLVAFSHDANAQISVAATRPAGGTDAPKLMNANLCVDGEDCRIADVDGDGHADVVVFGHGVTGNGVTVSRASRTELDLRTPVAWSDFFCLAGETCLLGDVNGDRAADIVAETPSNDVWLSTADD